MARHRRCRRPNSPNAYGDIMKLGVCYYPEQWPEQFWAQDAREMRELGLRMVRIGEFAWSRIEPEPGRLEWDWLDRVFAILHAEKLHIVLGTPTATPPKWLVDRYPDMLAHDEHGRPRGFGSRRHYCFSSPAYRAQAARITELLAQRYGQHPALSAWQTDNEYGCHGTVLSYSPAARTAFRRWLRLRYVTIQALNETWGNVFWSQEYNDFEQIDPPVGTVTEANPTHRLDYQRFASDEVISFNRIQVEILRNKSPGRDILHNFMGFFTGFDHHRLSKDLDVAAWDSYPLGATQNFFLNEKEKQLWAETGHPDVPAFHHDLYRGMCGGRWWVMEQQPGPVNWAHWNPAPAEGMVRLWTWQAFAHGAEVVSYFRWRQAPFAQEQMHAGLQRPDRIVDQGGLEARQVDEDLRGLGPHVFAGNPKHHADVALVFDYQSIWMSAIQPQGADFNAVELCFRAYSALRHIGLNVDVVSPESDFTHYSMIVLPVQMRNDEALAAKLQSTGARLVFGPRSGSKSEDFHIPSQLPPGAFNVLTGVRVTRVSSWPPGITWAISLGGRLVAANRWREDIECDADDVVGRFQDGKPAIVEKGRCLYVAAWLESEGWMHVLLDASRKAGLDPHVLPEGLRLTRRGPLQYILNFSNSPVTYGPSTENAHCLLGSREVPPRGVSIWSLDQKASTTNN